MIELLLQADRTLTMGLVDQAERLYRQAAEADPLNAIAVLGLARVAVERGDDRGAWELAVQALRIDPENASAIRLEARLAEILATRGEPVERPEWVLRNEAAWRARGTADLSARAASMPRPAPPRPVYPATPESGAAAAVAASAAMPPAHHAPAAPGTVVSSASSSAVAPPEPDAASERHVAPEPPVASGSQVAPAPASGPGSARKKGILARLFGR